MAKKKPSAPHQKGWTSIGCSVETKEKIERIMKSRKLETFEGTLMILILSYKDAMANGQK